MGMSVSVPMVEMRLECDELELELELLSRSAG
jgi:hypothetical protein